MPVRAVVLTLDRFHIGYLGCYGNDWMETPTFDRLATESVLFDRCFAADLDLQETHRAWWNSLSTSGIKTWLFAEADGGDAPFVAPAFDEVIAVSGADSLEAQEDQPPFARLVRTVIERLPEISSDAAPTLLWLKSRGIPVPWLPPTPFADLYLDEFGLDDKSDDDESDEPDLDTMEPAPAAMGRLTKDDAAVELKYARALYAAYVTWLDRWLGKLLRTLDAQPEWNDTLLIVAAARGQSLGERGELDEQATPLRAELVHVPLFVRLPGRLHDATRRADLVQTSDLAATLLDWFGLEVKAQTQGAAAGRSLLPIVRNEPVPAREFVLLQSPDELGVRNESCLYVESRAGTPSIGEPHAALLFEKPGDRWDMADVASQDPGACERLHEILQTGRLA